MNVVDSTVRIEGGVTVQNSRGAGLNVTGAGGSDVSLGHQAVSAINSLSNNCGTGARVGTGSKLNIQGDTLIESNGGSGVNVNAGARATFNAFPIKVWPPAFLVRPSRPRRSVVGRRWLYRELYRQISRHRTVRLDKSCRVDFYAEPTFEVPQSSSKHDDKSAGQGRQCRARCIRSSPQQPSASPERRLAVNSDTCYRTE